MKRLSILLVCLATIGLTSCSLSSLTSSNSAAQMAGKSCGSAVAQLFQVYNASKTIDLTNSNNLGNALALATAYTQLNENKGSADYRKAFASGLVSGAAGLITAQTAPAFIEKLLATTGLKNVNASNIANTATTALTIYSLLNSLK